MVNAELEKIRQLLTNNGFRGDVIEEGIKKQMEIFHERQQEKKEDKKEITIYHKMSYNNAFKQEENVLKNICKRGIKPTDPEKNINIRIYSKPNLLSALVMKNSTAPPKTKEATTNVVYRFTCSERSCESSKKTYIGLTTTTLRRRCQNHRNQGAIFQHFTEKHDRKPTVNEILDSTEIVTKETNFSRLTIAEAISIHLEKPTLNVQTHSHHILPSTRRQRALDVEALLQEARRNQRLARGPN